MDSRGAVLYSPPAAKPSKFLLSFKMCSMCKSLPPGESLPGLPAGTSTKPGCSQVSRPGIALQGDIFLAEGWGYFPVITILELGLFSQGPSGVNDVTT